MQCRLTMPSRSRKTDHCADCRLFRPLCVCGIIAETRAQLEGISTRLVVLMHVREVSLPTNTARLATTAVPGSELRLRGGLGEVMSTEGLVTPERQSLLLFPSDEAVELNPESVRQWEGRPLTLLVPDGSWRQARKAAVRISALQDIPRVKLPPGPPSRYRLRKEPNERSVSTFEAIARALGQLEGARGSAVQRALEELFELRIERTLWSRGLIPTAECRFPIPPEVFEAFHRAGSRGGEKAKALLEASRAEARERSGYAVVGPVAVDAAGTADGEGAGE
jgi:DTW domain-containing protein YfiP